MLSREREREREKVSAAESVCRDRREKERSNGEWTRGEESVGVKAGPWNS